MTLTAIGASRFMTRRPLQSGGQSVQRITACFGWPFALGAGKVQRPLRHAAREGWIARPDPGVNLEPRDPGGDNSVQAPSIEC